MDIKAKKKIDLWLGGMLIILLKPCVVLAGLILRRNHDLNNPENITFIKMQGGGSLVIALPAILSMREKYPSVRFTLITTKSVEPFAKLLNVFNEILIIDDQNIFTIAISSIRVVLKSLFAHLLIDLEVYSYLTAVLGLLTMAKNRVGFYLESVYWRKHLFTHLIFFNRYSGTYYFYEDVAKLVGAEILPFSRVSDYFIAKNNFKKCKSDHYTITIGHGCSDFGKERLLNEQQWTGIIEKHKQNKMRLLFLGAKNDISLADNIIKNIAGLESVNHCGKLSLKDSVEEIFNSDLFIGVDSALLHFARLLNVRTDSYWGPTDPATRLKENNNHISTVNYKKIPCSPCIHVTENPPCNGNNICVKQLFNEKITHEFNSFTVI